MDKEIFVQNVKARCEVLGIKPTRACKESGVGTSFLNDIKRGRSPSITNVQTLAAYLGVTISELLGEKEKTAPEAGQAFPTAADWEAALSSMSNDELLEVQDIIRKEFSVRLKGQNHGE